MSLAETAELLVLLKMKSEGVSQTESQLAGLNRTGNLTSGVAARASAGVGTLSRAATGLGGALSHAKGAIGGLISGPLGMIGLGAGLFTVAGAFGEGIRKAEDMAFSVEKLSAVTGMSAHTASQYLAVFEKFGVDGTAAVRSFGLMEKAIGQNTRTTEKAKNFADKYGLSLVDANGKALSAASVFQKLEAFENGNATASQKAAVAATLLGRNWVSLLPVLKLGTAGFAEAAAEADKLGLTLKSAQDVKNVHDFIAAQREAKDALAGLEVQLGLLIMPELVGPFRTFTTYVSTHQGEIKQFFRDAIGFAKQVGGAVLTIGGAFVKAWNAIPPSMRQLLLEGLVANKALKFTFGFDPLKIVTAGVGDAVGGAIKGLFGNFFQRGAPGNPMFVVQEGGAGLPGVGGGRGGLSPLGILGAAGGGLAIALAFKSIVQDPQFNRQSADIRHNALNQIRSGASAGDLQKALAGVSQGLADLKAVPLSGVLYGQQIADLQKTQKMYIDAIAALVKPTATAGQLGSGEHDKSLPTAKQTLAQLKSEGINLQQIKHHQQQLVTQSARNAQAIKSAVQNAAQVLSAVLNGGFAAVVGAVGGLPAMVGGVQQVHSRASGSGKVSAAQRASVPVGTEGNRGYVAMNINVNSSARQNESARTIQYRYGATPSSAGAT